MVGKGLVSRETLTGIADAIREKLESETAMLPGEMAAWIESIVTGYETVTGEMTLASNSSKLTVEHDLGRVPVLAFVIATASTGFSMPSTGESYQWAVYHIGDDEGGINVYHTTVDNYGRTYASAVGTATLAETTVEFVAGNPNASRYGRFPANIAYKYVIAG